MPPGKTLREIYRDERQRKTTTVFATIGVIMAALVLVCLLVLTGILPMPFSDFSRKPQYAAVGDVPCTTVEDAAPVPASDIRLQVLNATDRSGLASTVAETLGAAGYTITTTGNYVGGQFRGAAEIDAGPTGIDAAYTVARHFDEYRIRLTDEGTDTVTLVLGDAFGDAPTPEEVVATSQDTTPLTSIENCLPVAPDVAEGEESGAGQSEG